MNRLIAILLLLNFLLFIIPVNTGKSIAKQFSTSLPAEEENGTAKSVNIYEFGEKLLQQVKYHNFSVDIFHILSKEKFSHFKLHIPTVDWLKTFSPPPDKV